MTGWKKLKRKSNSGRLSLVLIAVYTMIAGCEVEAIKSYVLAVECSDGLCTQCFHVSFFALLTGVSVMLANIVDRCEFC
jgi:hypothetical protein